MFFLTLFFSPSWFFFFFLLLLRGRYGRLFPHMLSGSPSRLLPLPRPSVPSSADVDPRFGLHSLTGSAEEMNVERSFYFFILFLSLSLSLSLSLDCSSRCRQAADRAWRHDDLQQACSGWSRARCRAMGRWRPACAWIRAPARCARAVSRAAGSAVGHWPALRHP
jgi:hypothetical protein